VAYAELLLASKEGPGSVEIIIWNYIGLCKSVRAFHYLNFSQYTRTNVQANRWINQKCK